MYEQLSKPVLKKNTSDKKRFAVVSSQGVTWHWCLNLGYSYNVMKRKSKQASKALQHYYVHSVSGEEREPVSWWRKGRETKTPVKPESFLARGYTRTIADHRETGGGGGDGDASPDKEDNHIEQSSMVARTNTHSQTREPFSHTDLADVA